MASAAGFFCRSMRRAIPVIAFSILITSAAYADPRVDADTAAALSTSAGMMIAQQGVASWYGRAWRGRRTANGQRFDERLLTAASLSLPFAARAHVVNLQNGRSVDVVVNDRGPYHEGRIIDLSQRAAAALGMVHSGVAPVEISAVLLRRSG